MIIIARKFRRSLPSHDFNNLNINIDNCYNYSQDLRYNKIREIHNKCLSRINISSNQSHDSNDIFPCSRRANKLRDTGGRRREQTNPQIKQTPY